LQHENLEIQDAAVMHEMDRFVDEPVAEQLRAGMPLDE
jgi:hypothetical protein